MRRYLLTTFIGVLTTIPLQSALAANTVAIPTKSTSTVAVKYYSDPYKMVDEVSKQLFAKITAQQSEIKVNPNILRDIVYTDLMPHADPNYSSLKVLGQLARKFTKEERKKFAEAFGKYMASNLAQVLTLYKGQKVVVEKAKVLKKGQKFASVKLDIISKGAPKIELIFSLRKNKKTQRWGTYDLTAEGISIIRSKQAEWRPQIQKDGIAAVTQKLEKLASSPIQIKTKEK